MALLQSDEDLNSEDIPVPRDCDADVLGADAWTVPLSYGRAPEARTEKRIEEEG